MPASEASVSLQPDGSGKPIRTNTTQPGGVGPTVHQQVIELTDWQGNLLGPMTADNGANALFKAPVLPAKANSAVEAWTAGNQVPLSADLAGYLRTLIVRTAVTVLNQTQTATTNFSSADLAVDRLSELAIDLNLTTLTGGTTPSIQLLVDRKGADGIYYQIDNPTALSAVGALSRSLGAGTANPVVFGNLLRVRTTILGAPTTIAYTISAIGK